MLKIDWKYNARINKTLFYAKNYFNFALDIRNLN